jgi:preprotein translocase subunit SecG
MIAAFIILIIIVCVFLVLVVLAQDSKGGGAMPQLGASQIVGVQKTTDILEKLTWGFVGALMVLSLSANILVDTDGDLEGPSSINVERAKTKAVAAPPSVGPQSTGGDQVEPNEGAPAETAPAKE